MKKRFFLFGMILVFLTLAFPVSAGFEPNDRVVDNAGLLDPYDEQTLTLLLDEISERQECDVIIVTVNSLDGKRPLTYAHDFYDKNGCGQGASRDGILLLLSMEDRDWAISTCGFGITAFTDARQERLVSAFLPHLSSGDYNRAFTRFAQDCDRILTTARADEIYETEGASRSFQWVWAVIAVLVGAGISLIVVLCMKAQLKSIRPQRGAQSYISPGSLRLTRQSDLFLYRQVARTRRAEENSNSRGGRSTISFGSSGTRHGGSSGKF